MECPWPNIEEVEESSTGIVCDLAKLRVSAAMALEKIESTYKEIMGCSREYDDSELSPDFIDSELNNSYSPRKSFSGIDHILSEPQQIHVHTNHICRICHKAFTVPSYNFGEQMYFGFHDQGHNCENFTGIRNPYFLNKVENYPEEDRPSSGSSSKVSNRNGSDKENKIAVHKCPLKVTIPEPFQMTVRDEDQKIVKELKMEQLRKQLREEKEKEMQVTFHSSPIPGHVYMPIYQKIVKQNEERKLRRKQTAENIKNSAKVCNISFSKKNCLRKADSVPDLSAEEKQQTMFKARPAPQHILSSDVSERIKNREAVRKFQSRQRAQEMLQQASLPFSSRRSFNRSSSLINLRKEEEQKAQRTIPKYRKADSTFTSSESRDVLKQWNSKVRELSSTDNSTPPLTEKIDKKNYESRYQEFLLAQSSPLYDIPIRMTAASMLREKEIRRELSEKSGNIQKGKNKPQKFKETREQLLSQLKMKDLTATVQEDLERKLQNYRQSRKLRQQEYEKELMEMKIRVGKHPLLIERQSKSKNDPTEEDDQSDPHSSSEASTNHSTSDD